MITMTLDPARFPSGPQAGYEAACARFHAWNQSLKRMQGEDLNAPALRWARKMELHENGWPHWHMLVNLRKLKRDELKRLDEKWGLGSTNIEFIRDKNALQYALKYCMKGVSRSEQDDNHGLPAWILDLDKKARWWQTHAFYSPSPCAPRSFEETSAVIEKPTLRTIRQRIFDEKNKLEVVVFKSHAEKPCWRTKIALECVDNTSIYDVVRGALEPGEIPASLGTSRSFITRINTTKIKEPSWQSTIRVLQTVFPVSRVYASLAA